MYRLVYRTFLGVVVLIALLVVFVAGTRASSGPLAILATTPQGMPCDHWCLFGAEPETMGYARAQYLLTKHPLVRGLDIVPASTYDYFIGQDVDVAHGAGYVSIQFHEPIRCEGRGLARPECFKRGNNLFLNSLRRTLPLHVIIDDLGAPDYFQQGTDKYGAPLIILNYRTLRSEFVYQLKDGKTVSPADEIVAIWLFSQGMFDDQAQRSPCYTWPGFGMLRLSPSESGSYSARKF